MAYDNRLAGFDYRFDHFVWNDVTKSSPATGVIRLSGGKCLDDYCWDYINFGINFYVPSGVNYIPTGAYTVSSTGAVGTVAQGPSECNTSNAGFFKDVDAYNYTNFWWFFKSGFVYIVNAGKQEKPTFMYLSIKDSEESVVSAIIGTEPTKRTVNITYGDENGNGINASAAIGYWDEDGTQFWEGDEITLTPVDAEGWIFEGWTGDNSNELKKNNDGSYTLLVGAKNYTLTPSWKETVTGTVTASADPVAGGSVTVSPSGPLPGGTPVTLTVEENEGYRFVMWEDDESTDKTRQVIVAGDDSYTAIFKEKVQTTVNFNNNYGLVTVNVDPIDGYYYEGQNLTLTATALAEKYTITEWLKDGDHYAGASLVLDIEAGNNTYTAVFEERDTINIDIPFAAYSDNLATYSLRGNDAGGTTNTSSGYYISAHFDASNNSLDHVESIYHNGTNLSFTNYVLDEPDQPCGNRVVSHLYCNNATGDIYHFSIHWRFPWNADSNDSFNAEQTMTITNVSYNNTYGALEIYGEATWTDWGKTCYNKMDLLFITGTRCSDDIMLPEGTYPIECTGNPNTVYANPGVTSCAYAKGCNQGVVFGTLLITTGTVVVSRNGNNYTIQVTAKNSYENDIIGTLSGSITSTSVPSYTLNVNTDGHGTARVYRYDCNDNENLVSNSGSYKQGSYFKLEAEGNSGYAFDYWTIDGVDEHFTNNPETLDGLYSNAIITAHFKTVSTDLVLKDGVSTGQTDINFDEFAATYNGQTMSSVTLNRTFTAGNWATICLPFYVDESQLTNAGLFRKVYEFRYATGSADVGDQVTFHFRVATSMEAGRGYLVKGTSGMGSSFVFNNVTINTSADTEADVNDLKGVNAYYDESVGSSEIAIVGVLRSGTLSNDDRKVMGLANNKIWYPHSSGNPMPAYRAYFYNPNASASVMPRVRIVVEGEGTTELEVVDGELISATEDSCAPRKYIRNGVLIIERNGVRYDAQGKRM